MYTRFALIFVCALTARAAALPAGTELEVRLTTTVASNRSKPQEAVEAVLIRPVFSGAGIALASGSVVRGVVKRAAAIAKAGDRAALDLAFASVTPPAGKPVPIVARVKSVDNARESVDADGRITGILPSETLAARIQTGVERVGQRYAQLGELLEGVRSAVLKEPEPEIVYGPGVELTLELTKAAECPAAAATFAVEPVTPDTAVFTLVNAQPFRTATEAQKVPSDLTNLMFLGTQAQLEAAFQAAGWASAAQLNTASGIETFRAIAEMRGYKEAPMSVLLLDGRKPDLVFQKQNNTFAKRHHLRIWRRPGDFAGRPVWVCAATHDIGIELSAEQRNFIHKIDPQIDRERAKVSADLLFTGKVKGLSLVERAAVPQHSRNATGDNLETDGKMAVLLLE
jgi:hypothetical protein